MKIYETAMIDLDIWMGARRKPVLLVLPCLGK